MCQLGQLLVLNPPRAAARALSRVSEPTVDRPNRVHMSAIATPIAARAALTAGPARCARPRPRGNRMHPDQNLPAPCQSLIGGRSESRRRERSFFLVWHGLSAPPRVLLGQNMHISASASSDSHALHIHTSLFDGFRDLMP